MIIAARVVCGLWKIFSRAPAFSNAGNCLHAFSWWFRFLIWLEKIIFSDNLSIFIYIYKNIIEASSFRYSNNTEVLKANNIQLLDKDKNEYFLTKGFVNLKENTLLGKDIKINF